MIVNSNEAEQLRQEEIKDEAISNALKVSGGIGGSALLLKTVGQEKKGLSNFYQNLLGAEFLQRQLEKAPTWTRSGGEKFRDQALSKSLLSQLMALEEVSPLHIMRTLQLSNILQPLIKLVQDEQEIVFTKRKIRAQQHYYQSLIEFSNKDISETARRNKVKAMLTHGMAYNQGKLYALDNKGLIDKTNILVNEARVTLSSVVQGTVTSPNNMFLNYVKSIGSSVNLDMMKNDPITVVGGKNIESFSTRWGKSWGYSLLEMGMKSLDNPLAGVEETLKGVGLDNTSFFESRMWKTAKKYTNVQLGTNGDYSLGFRKSFIKSGKNVAIKSTGVVLGYEIADSLMRSISPSDGLFHDGIYTGLTNLYGAARIKVAEVWSDRFQGYKKSQEEAAAGSTSLASLLALPMAGALAGAQLGYFQRLGKTAVSNTDEAAKVYNVAKESPFLKAFGLDKKYKPMKKNALIGALAGGALALPFLPGALIGESSDELRELYSGKKEVAQKANRWWMFGGTPWEGSHTQYYTKHNVARVNADGTDKVRYGDDDTKKKLNPLLHPLAYIKDPYRYEKMHAEDMPYPVWGMDVGYGSVYGKLFERTVGQVIKPDKINPAIYDLVTSGDGESHGGIKNDLFKIIVKGAVGEQITGKPKIPMQATGKDAQLIKEGIMVPEADASYNPNLEASGLVYQAGVDLVGLKGWTGSLGLALFGVDTSNTPLQLARSGEATSSARDLVDANLGDMFGFGEFQRKILGTSSGSLPDRLNPLNNNSAYWLPNKDTQYYINFAKGNPYSHIKNGEERLPGVGFAALNPEVEGVDPNDYSLVYKYKVLADVAKGSREHIRARQEVLEAHMANQLSKVEREIVEQTLDQEVERDQRKKFYEPSDISKRAGFGPLGYIQSSLWDSISEHGELPTEMLTPIRPMAKFLHNRTAIQDYIHTQLGGSDAAIWTNPYQHFLKPAANKSRLLVDRSFKAEEVREKENIDEYFDKLGHLRNRSDSTPLNDGNSVLASSMSGLNTKEKVLKFKKSLSDSEKDYFDSFSLEKDEKKRDMIRSLVPKDVLRGYEQIWRNSDIAERAKKLGVGVQGAIAQDLHIQTGRMAKAFGVSLTKEDMDVVRNKVYNDSDSYARLGFSTSERIKYTADEALRMKMADKEATTYVETATGVPSSSFMGWDPRLTTDDIKIRTLSVGGEDLKRFGFWKSDEDRMNRIPVLKDEDQVIHSLTKIKADMKSNVMMKRQIELTMFNNGFKPSRISIMDSDYGSLRIKED